MLHRNVENFIGCDSSYRTAGIVLYGAPFDSTTSYRPGARLALDVIKYRDATRTRNAELRLLKARGTVEEKRAEGTHVDRVEHNLKDPLDELRSRLDRIALAGEASGDPQRADD